MKFERVAFDECRSMISKILNYQPVEKYDVTPNEIFCIVEEIGIVLDRKHISDWSDFESGKKNITIDQILENTKIKFDTEEPIVIISDECFRDQRAYKIPTDKLKEFAEQTYPNLHRMELIQPLDLIFIQPSTRSIVMIHHEGTVMEF